MPLATGVPGLPGISSDQLYAAMVAHDARFDGRFFVGVTSTGIYCRPVCRVRTPQQRNCRFFAHPASAEAAGFRPCMRCRPELAPGLSLVDSPGTLAAAAARCIDDAVHEGQPLAMPEVARRLGVSDRHLRRIFQGAYGVSPLAYLGTRRLLLAKQLLTDTGLPVTQVALSSGFGSLRRFNAAFAARYRTSPGALRRGRDTDAAPHDAALAVRLAYRPPYDVCGMLHFLAARQLPGVEAVQPQALSLRRTLACSHGAQRQVGWLALRFVPERHEVQVQVSPTLVAALGAVIGRLRQCLDLDADPATIDRALAALPLPPVPGIRVPGGVDGFEIATRVILGQQVTVAAARTLTHRLVQALGEPIATPFDDLHRLFPTAQQVAQADAGQIGHLGILRQRVAALQALARAVAGGQLALHRGAPLAPTLQALRALPGIGEWTAQLIAMRALSWPDAFPASDLGVLDALGTRDAAIASAMSGAWRPWRSYAVMRLWQSRPAAA